jgi:uncharacterized membrane protein YwzB
MRLATELVIGIVCLGIVIAMVWWGRAHAYSRFMQNGLVFVTYPAVVLIFVAVAAATLITGFLR